MKFFSTLLLALPTITLAVSDVNKAVARIMAEPTPECKSASAAYAKIREAYDTMRNTNLYMFGSIINEEPTHTELQEASKYMIDNVLPPQIEEAKKLNALDKKWARKSFIQSKVAFLEYEVKVAKKLLGKGLPKYPWVSDAIKIASDIFPKMQELWQLVKNKGKKTPPPTGTVTPTAGGLDPQKIIEAISAKLAAIDKQFYDLVSAECKMG
jgi:hypothetical protein